MEKKIKNKNAAQKNKETWRKKSKMLQIYEKFGNIDITSFGK